MEKINRSTGAIRNRPFVTALRTAQGTANSPCPSCIPADEPGFVRVGRLFLVEAKHRFSRLDTGHVRHHLHHVLAPRLS